ncbi:MAG: TIGR02391 family protein [Magnetococcales bacterium]|nr:TIGR02391 family protein [Magnetococcales bacterium]MBF0116432.1 TIGR02391 family protein [Magnetococcales bacterium]
MQTTTEKIFSQSELESIAKALSNESSGLTGTEISLIFESLNIVDDNPSITKWKRLYYAFVKHQNNKNSRRVVLEFIRRAIKPERYIKQVSRFENLRTNLNQVLSFSGIAVDSAGELISADRAETISEAMIRANELRAELVKRGVHPDVLCFCRSELLDGNYFHAVLEATKSVADKLRKMTNINGDGADLVDKTLTGNMPVLAINALNSDSQKNEQKGFVNLVKGTIGMFRNTTAHEARILWPMSKEDAEDLLSLVSLIHRRLDSAIVRKVNQ